MIVCQSQKGLTRHLSWLHQPKVVTDTEDEELQTQLEKLRLANEEVAGDDDTSDQEGVPADEPDEPAAP